MSRIGRLSLALVFAALTAAVAHGQGAPMFGGFISDAEEAVSIDADLLEWLQLDGRDVLQYSGDVQAIRGDMTIRAGRLTVFLPIAGADGAGTFDRIEASGNVRITTGAQSAAADRAIMDMVARTVTLIGNVSLDDGTNQMSGDELTIDLETGGWRLGAGEGRVRSEVRPAQ